MADEPATAEQKMLAAAYAAFNARDIDGVLRSMHTDVEWPNGMEGGYVYGHDEVRAYWTRQWRILDPHVEPVRFAEDERGWLVLDVRQVVRDRTGSVVVDQMIQHAYRVERGLIRRMEIRPVAADHRIVIRRESLDGRAAALLIPKLNAELSAVYPEPGANHFGLSAEDVAPENGAFLVVYRDDRPIGCGAVRLIDAATAELKRMFVEPEARGQRIGYALVEALEAAARHLGAERLVLETGIRQVAAVALYERCGFTPIPLYGEYCLSPDTSLCLGKTLSAP